MKLTEILPHAYDHVTLTFITDMEWVDSGGDIDVIITLVAV